ncbi:DMT family transporter [Rubrobacter indicoceani]|uniref:DMT family transporter n=1 Tax=Rubrobacter indicoceani TaxID=2051957 RepID=UPI001F098A30|nr:DMT family transporter [Rubrobacter indicoceani]
MMGLVFLVPLALLAGTAIAAQFAVNSQLRGVVGGPVIAAAVSFIIGSVALTVAAIVYGRGLPQVSQMEFSGAPWWVWTGGILGGIYVLASVLITPRLGAAPTVAMFLTGQMSASVVIDHFGLLGVQTHEATLPRIVGVAFILVGVFLIQRY